MPSGNFKAVTTAAPPLSVAQFYPNQTPPPGSVGLCLSGGGSRAMTAGMGQLQALSYLTLSSANAGMLSQIKALSTVSGGSWLGVPYQFLPSSAPSDSAFLGTYDSNIGSVTKAELAKLSSQSAAYPITNTFFGPVFLALQAVLFYNLGVPTDMLWQTIVGINMLSPVDLYNIGSNMQPNDMFSFDAQTLSSQVTVPNLRLRDETAYLVASAAGRTPRPYYVCNMGMFVNMPAVSLVPVQATPFMTGIVGTPKANDANHLPPGGGGVTSFAFNSNLASVNGGNVSVNQTRQWSLTDIAGTSSAFFAAILKQFIEDPAELIALALLYRTEILEWIEKHLPLAVQTNAKAMITNIQAQSQTADFSIHFPKFPNPAELIPQYGYWPVLNPTVVTNPVPNTFADGGSLENTGINALLAYSDIKGLIACVNSEQPLVTGAYGIADGQGGYLPGTYVIVDDSIPPLFGYQPYADGKKHACKGYQPYVGGSCLDPDNAAFANNQVFPSAAFQTLLQNLWAAANNGGSNATPAIYSQTLQVLPNSWFGVQAKSQVTIVWCYLNFCYGWLDLFSNNQAVTALIKREIAEDSFPNYKTLNTNLDATQVNLMSNLAAWMIVQEETTNQTFSNLFNNA